MNYNNRSPSNFPDTKLNILNKYAHFFETRSPPSNIMVTLEYLPRVCLLI